MDKDFEKIKFGNFISALKTNENIIVGTPLFLPPYEKKESLIANEATNVFSLGIVIILMESQPSIRKYKTKKEHENLLIEFLRVFEEDSKLKVLNTSSKGIL